MTRTRRVYNNPKKWLFRILQSNDNDVFYEIDDVNGNQALISRQTTDSFMINIVERNYYLWLLHGVLCMGHCPRCKNQKRDQQERTRKKKEMKFL